MEDVFIKIIAAPVKLVVTLLKHPRYLVLLGIGIFVFVGFNAARDNFIPASASPKIPDYQLIAPAVEKASHVVQTSSRIYYTSHFTDDGDIVLLEDYYAYNGEKWVKGTQSLPLSRKYYGEIKIYAR